VTGKEQSSTTGKINKSTIFWDITPSTLPPAFTLVSCSAYFFDPEDGGDMFLESSLTDYTEL
jgi:hypothetical protein